MTRALSDVSSFPLLWINLNREPRRRARMEWAIREGGWRSHRLEAIDAQQKNQHLLPFPNPCHRGTSLPGLRRQEEPQPKRRTTRAELACLASWKRLLIQAEAINSPSGWLLLMEDDLGASLAAPHGWAHSLSTLIDSCPSSTLAIQLAPISATARHQLHNHWLTSNGRSLSLPKEEVRSHGNGAVLIKQRAIPRLIGPLQRLTERHCSHWHLLSHPWRIRPVADKWLYGSLPSGSCRVATYPHFCLEANDSSLHQSHVCLYHQPSRTLTLELWQQDGRNSLIQAQQTWDQITSMN